MVVVERSQLPNLVAGCAGGVVATLILHPLDLVKVRLQGMQCSIGTLMDAVQDSSRIAYKGTFDAFATIARKEGTRELYRVRLCLFVLTAQGGWGKHVWCRPGLGQLLLRARLALAPLTPQL